MNDTPEPVIATVTAKHEQPQALVPQSLTPAQMLSIAVQQGADTQKLKELMDLQDRYEAKQARLAYSNAIVQFQAICPVVIRTGNNTRFGNQYPQWSTAYPQIKPALDTAQLGTTHSLRQDDKGQITVIGQVRHGPSGHIEEVSLSAPPDRLSSKEGKAIRNEVQAIKSTITYLEWLTMECLLGLKSRDRKKGEAIPEPVATMVDGDDDDGNGSGNPPEPPKPQTPSDPETVARTAFWNTAQQKAGVAFTATQARAIFSRAQQASGKASAVDCLGFLRRDDVLIAADGTLSVATDADDDFGPEADQAPAAAEPHGLQGGADPASTFPPPPSSELSMNEMMSWPNACDECGKRYKVMPAGGQCTAKSCFGHVAKVGV